MPKDPASIMENELGMCEVLLYLFPPRDEGLGSAEENLPRLLKGDRVGGRGGVSIFFNYLFLSFTSPLCFPNSSLSKIDRRNCYRL